VPNDETTPTGGIPDGAEDIDALLDSTTTPASAPRPDIAAIGAALGVIVVPAPAGQPNPVVELRIPHAGRARVVAGYYDDLDRLGCDAARANRDYGIVYATLNPIKRGLLARSANRLREYAEQTTADHDVTRLRRLLIDIDPERS